MLFSAKRNHSSSRLGFSLIEIMTATTVMAITFAIVASMATLGRQRSLLQLELTKLKSAIEYTRQQSLAAYRGQEYSIRIDPPESFTLLPENTTKKLRVDIDTPTTSREIMFEKLTGKPDQEYVITLVAGNYFADIKINAAGVISTTNPETR